jgi:ribose transport system permease protein
VLAFASPHFLTISNILNILLQGSTLAILGSGVTITLVSGEIDLSIASVEALTGVILAVLVVQQRVWWPVATVFAIIAGGLAGSVNGLFTTRYGIPSFVATLAMLGIARGLAYVISNGVAVYGFPEGLLWIGQGKIGGIAFPIIMAVIVLFALHFVMSRTRFGLNAYAVGGSAEAARLGGVDVARVKMLVMALSGLMAALAGVVLAARLGAGSGNVAESDLLDAIAAVVIGGTSLMGGVGSIAGTAMGVLLIASIRNGLVLLGVSAFWQLVAIGTLILGAVFIDHLTKRLRAGG